MPIELTNELRKAAGVLDVWSPDDTLELEYDTWASTMDDLGHDDFTQAQRDYTIALFGAAGEGLPADFKPVGIPSKVRPEVMECCPTCGK